MNDKKRNHPRVAIVYDRVNKIGGAERLLDCLHRMYPEAPLYTSVYDKSGAPWAKGWEIRTSFLQRWKWARQHHELLAPLMPIAFESFDFSEFDVVISVSSEAAKGVITKPGTQHICWMLTPTRYLWSGADAYAKDYLTGGLEVLKPLYRSLLHRLRSWDEMAAWRPDMLVPISQKVSNRIEKYYSRKPSSVVYPPVNTHFFVPASKNLRLPTAAPQDPFLLVVSRLVPYKKVDLAIHACIEEKIPLVIIGTGGDQARLKGIARNSSLVRFLGQLTDEETLRYYQSCQGFLFPAEDDFGLTAIEALSCGRPVAVNARSGNAELLVDKKHGILVTESSIPAWRNAARQLMERSWLPSTLRQTAERISIEQCERQWKELVQ